MTNPSKAEDTYVMVRRNWLTFTEAALSTLSQERHPFTTMQSAVLKRLSDEAGAMLAASPPIPEPGPERAEGDHVQIRDIIRARFEGGGGCGEGHDFDWNEDEFNHVSDRCAKEIAALSQPHETTIPGGVVEALEMMRDEADELYRWMHGLYEANGRSRDEGSLSADAYAWRERCRNVFDVARSALALTPPQSSGVGNHNLVGIPEVKEPSAATSAKASETGQVQR
jgi:hypothetical protein